MFQLLVAHVLVFVLLGSVHHAIKYRWPTVFEVYADLDSCYCCLIKSVGRQTVVRSGQSSDQHDTRNEWQSLACSPRGIAVTTLANR